MSSNTGTAHLSAYEKKCAHRAMDNKSILEHLKLVGQIYEAATGNGDEEKKDRQRWYEELSKCQDDVNTVLEHCDTRLSQDRLETIGTFLTHISAGTSDSDRRFRLHLEWSAKATTNPVRLPDSLEPADTILHTVLLKLKGDVRHKVIRTAQSFGYISKAEAKTAGLWLEEPLIFYE